jgi:Holliday junction DNA helicase RuvA
MISILTGTVLEKGISDVVLDVHGVGYGLYVTAEDHGRLALGEQAKVYIYEHIREQSHDLFGFLTKDTKNLFEQLLGVNGVGPKMALNILSVGTGSQVRVAIAGGDVKFIQQANGVGKKVAERVVVELKDKVGLVGVDLQSTGLLQGDGLVSLGYSAQDAAKALQTVDTELATAERIRQALSGARL